MHIFPKSLSIVCGYTVLFASDLVGNPDNRFPNDAAHPGRIFGHVNAVLRICTRVQIFSNSRGGVNCAHERKNV